MPALPDNYAISLATAADIPALIAADKAASELFVPTGLLDAAALDDHVPANVFETEIPLKNVIAVRRSNKEAVGFALFRPLGDGLYLDQVSVSPEHGQKGLGRALVLKVITEAEKRRLPHVSLSTFRDLPWNGPFYASMGFKELTRDKLEPFMLEIEDAQRSVMDVTKRCFMRRKVRRSLFDRLKPV